MARKRKRERKRARGHVGLPNVCIGVAWFDAVQFTKLRQVADDLEAFDENFEDWQRSADRSVRELLNSGLAIRRVPIDVDALVAWCRKHGKPIVSASRAEFTTEILMNESKDPPPG
ncbi:MAG TPA: hypothetical protein VND64_14330 [Pirellulales bacterium]|nr:hypothetical protein [Pirellulales bacterium]